MCSDLNRNLLSPEDVARIFGTFAAANPKPETELQYVNPYTLLVAVVLSAQATDRSVNKATATLFQWARTPEQMLSLGETEIKKHIKSIGLHQSKARNILKLSHMLLSDYAGQVPDTRTALERLPGVGRKTANVVLNVAFGQPTIAVDTHIFRVANRIGLCASKTPLETEKCLERRIPDGYKLHAHHWLILHGRYNCKARKPLCPDCPIRSCCAYPYKEE
jgi:endonuclease-3